MSGPSDLRLVRSISRRWPKASATTRESVAASAGKRGASRRSKWTTALVTLGGGVKARGGTSKAIADTRTSTEVLLAISRDSREDVDALLAQALAAGAAEPRPVQDYGFMYGRAFEDPDGHTWEVIWMDVEAAMAAGAVKETA